MRWLVELEKVNVKNQEDLKNNAPKALAFIGNEEYNPPQMKGKIP